MMATMRVRVKPDYRAWIAAGHDPGEDVLTVDLDGLSPEDRALLARWVTMTAGDLMTRGEYRIGRAGCPDVIIPLPTVDALMTALRAAEAQQAAQEEAERQRYEESIRQALEAPLEAWITKPFRGVPRVNDMPTRVFLTAKAQRDPRIQARRQEAEQHALPAAMEEYERAQQAEAERQRAEAAERQRQEEELRQWALKRGSERVRLLIEEEHPAWRPVAESEFLTAYTPEGFTPLEELQIYTVHDRTKPHVADIVGLREARALVEASNGVLAEPRMAWIVVYRPATEDEIDEGLADKDGHVVAEKFAATLLTVCAPTGARREIYRRVQTA